MKRSLAAKKAPRKRQTSTRALLDERSVLVDLVRNVCYRYGLAMARFEFKGKIPKPSIDEFRERIVHHMNLIEDSLKDKFSKNVRKPLEPYREILNTRLKLDAEKIRNGANAEVEATYDSLK